MKIIRQLSDNQVMVEHEPTDPAPTGTQEFVRLNDTRTVLAYQHGLADLIKGEPAAVFTADADSYTMEVRPDTESNDYVLRYVTGDKSDHVVVPAEQMTKVFETIQNICEGDADGGALLSLYEDQREGMVRKRAVDDFARECPPLREHITVQKSGWLIYGHLRLTYDGSMYHPNTDSRELGGSITAAESANVAYKVDLPPVPDDATRQFSHDGHEWLLTDDELDFIALALWAIENAPEEDPTGIGADTDWFGGVITDGQYELEF